MHGGSFSERLVSPQFYELILHLTFKQKGKQSICGVRKYPRSTVQLLRCTTNRLGNMGVSNNPGTPHMGTLGVHQVLHVDALMVLCPTGVLKILVKEHSYLLPFYFFFKKRWCFGLGFAV